MNTPFSGFTAPGPAGGSRRRGTPPRLPMLRGLVCASGRKAVSKEFSYG
jgi:hypothetical protein